MTLRYFACDQGLSGRGQRNRERQRPSDAPAAPADEAPASGGTPAAPSASDAALDRESASIPSMSAAQLVSLLTRRSLNVRNAPTVEGKRRKLEQDVQTARTWAESHASDPSINAVQQAIRKAEKSAGIGSGLFDALIRTPEALTDERPGALGRLWNPSGVPFYNKPLFRGIGTGALIFGLTGLALAIAQTSTPSPYGEALPVIPPAPPAPRRKRPARVEEKEEE